MLETGILFWADRDDIAAIPALGVRVAQIAVSGSMALDAIQWSSAIAASGLRVVTVVAAFDGEDYADIPTVERTVGFIPTPTREERTRRMLAVSDFGSAIGVNGIACHIGFVPEDAKHPDYIAVREVVRRICDRAEENGQTFALETGQERADVLLRFIQDVDRPNLRINFDPANLILYGTGDPIEALRLLAPLVVSVHCKDGNWPPKEQAGALGSEQPLGKGAVGVEKFVRTLEEVGYTGPLIIERECADEAQRWRDIADAVRLLQRINAA